MFASPQLEDVKGELLERFKVLPVLSSRVSELESNNDELREKSRQMEQKLGTMQVKGAPLLPRSHCNRTPGSGGCRRHGNVVKTNRVTVACGHQREAFRIRLYIL